MITVIGAGAFGTALAVVLGRERPVCLWARDAAHVLQMQKTRENTRRLPGVTLPDGLSVISELPMHEPEDICLLAVPLQQLRKALTAYARQLSPASLVACCKGIELTSGLGPVQLIRHLLPDTQAGILTGPGFAQDIARGLPTAMTLACSDSQASQQLQNQLSTPSLRLYRSTDPTGAELGGALKNVLAIGCGAVIGAGLGESARAALMTRGFAEIERLAMAEKADPRTLSGLSGFGDLVLTCTSEQSRNYRFGLSLGQSVEFDPEMTVEGVPTAPAVLQRAQRFGVDMPVVAAIVAVIDRKLHVTEAVETLLARPLKEE